MNLSNFILCIFVAFLWSLQPILHKMLKKNIDVFILFILVWIFTSLFMIIFLFYYKNHIYENIINLTKFELLIFISIGIMCVLANYLYFNIIKIEDSYIVSAITYSSPVFTILVAYLLLQENISISSIIGILLIVVGAVILSFN
jgi:transporter family protein